VDYFVWVLDNGTRQIVVDNCYDQSEGHRRNRPIFRDPATSLAALGLNAETLDTVLITHLHYDHAGGLDRDPSATFYFKRSRCPLLPAHACAIPRSGHRLRPTWPARWCATSTRAASIVSGDGEVVPSVTVHKIGGHSKGLQVVRVTTETGPLCLASDAVHYY